MSNTFGLECQVRYLAEMVNALNRRLEELIKVLEKKEGEHE